MIALIVTAADARQSRIEALEGKSTGSASPGQVVYVRRMLDGELHDRMADCGQISADQAETATRLASMWNAAGLNPRVSARIAYVHDELDDEIESAMTDDDETPAIDRWRRLMQCLRPPCARVIEDLLLGEHPGLRWLATLQAALDDARELLGLDQKSSPARPRAPARD